MSRPYIITAYKKQTSKSISHVIAQIREFQACINPKCNPRLQVQVFPHITVHITIHSTCLKQIAPMQIPNEHHLHCKIQERTLNPKDILGQRTCSNKECSCHIWNHGDLQNRHEIFHNLINKKMCQGLSMPLLLLKQYSVFVGHDMYKVYKLSIYFK